MYRVLIAGIMAIYALVFLAIIAAFISGALSLSATRLLILIAVIPCVIAIAVVKKFFNRPVPSLSDGKLTGRQLAGTFVLAAAVFVASGVIVGGSVAILAIIVAVPIGIFAMRLLLSPSPVQGQAERRRRQ